MSRLSISFLLIIFLFVLFLFRQKRLIYHSKIAFSRDLFSRINKTDVSFWRWIKNLLLMVVVVLLTNGIFILDMHEYSIDKKVNRKKDKTLFLLDVSLSMISEDVTPSRLERAKLNVISMMNKFSESSFALIPFAGSAFLQCPFTDDEELLKQYLNIINRDTISTGGTYLAGAIELSLKVFDKKSIENNGKRNLVILTDGADLTGNLEPFFSTIRKRNINVLVIGIGGDKFVPIQLGRNLYKKNRNGEIVRTKLNEKFLSNLASSIGGTYISSPKEYSSDFSFKIGTHKKNNNFEFIIYVIVPLIILGVELFLTTRSKKRVKWIGRFCN